MRLHAYQHFRSHTIRIVTANKRSLIWELSQERASDILKMNPNRSNIRDLIRVAVRMGLHKNIPKENRGASWRSWVHKGEVWVHLGSLDTLKEKP
jgi:hypothetical protein